MSEEINSQIEKTAWQRFIDAHSQPRIEVLQKGEVSFFRRAWNRSPNIDEFRNRITPYGFEIVRQDNDGPYCIAANNGLYCDITAIGISSQDARAKIGTRHVGFDHVRAEALKWGNYLKHGMTPAAEGSFDRLEQALHNRRMLMQTQHHQGAGDDNKRGMDAIRQCWQEMENIRPFFSTKRNGAAFIRNLERAGFQLARNERNGFVAVNQAGQVYGLRGSLKVKSHILTECLGPVMKQPTVPEVVADSRYRRTLARINGRMMAMSNQREQKGKGLGR